MTDSGGLFGQQTSSGSSPFGQTSSAGPFGSGTGNGFSFSQTSK